jgi:hypothetical protein
VVLVLVLVLVFSSGGFSKAEDGEALAVRCWRLVANPRC